MTETDQIKVRLPLDLGETIRQQANQEQRSINTTITRLIRAGLEATNQPKE